MIPWTLLTAGVAVAILAALVFIGRHRGRVDELGSVSRQWLTEHSH
jgi:hypothetical protein